MFRVNGADGVRGDGGTGVLAGLGTFVFTRQPDGPGGADVPWPRAPIRTAGARAETSDV